MAGHDAATGADDDFEDDSTELELQFAAAAKRLEQLVTQLDQQRLLEFYALYKQATVGACNTPKPGIFSLQARAKWHAWTELAAMNTETAMRAYVSKMTELQPDWQACKTGAKSTASWAAVSRPIGEPDADASGGGSDGSGIADAIKVGDLQRVVDLLPGVPDVNALDAAGLALLHWAADRGDSAVLAAVLAAPGCDVNVRDESGQTALHYACSVGHAECVAMLLRAGAERNAADAEGQTCAEVAASEEIRRLVVE